MTDLVIALSVMFVVAGVLLLVANHFGFSVIPFYIIAGLITGTFVFQPEVIELAQPDLVELAQWGIAFLVFVFGIRVEFSDIQSVLRDGEIAAFTQLIVVAPIAFAVGYAFGIEFGFEDPARNAIYFAAAATFSSTIVSGALLEAEIRDNLVHGRLASSIHFFDDMVAIFALLVLSAATLTDAQLITSNIGYGVIFLIAALLMYRHGFPLLIRFAEGFDELVLMGSISILIAFIAAAEYVGISIVIGAFAAGIAIRSEGSEALGVQNGIESIKDFFVAIFFITIGALVQFPTQETFVLAVSLVVLVVFLNPFVHILAFVYEGYDTRTAFLASSSLNQMSELSLVIAIQAWLLGTISTRLFDAIILAAAITMILTVFTRRYESTIYDVVVSRLFTGRQTRHVDEYSSVEDAITNHVVVIGFGRQGRLLVEKLEEQERPYVVVENDPVLWGDLRTRCDNYVFGDALADYPMERAGVDDATLIVSTVEHRPVSETVLRLDTDADVILRAGSSRVARDLLDAGATFVNVPSLLASEQLVENIERVTDRKDATELQREHLRFLDTLEREGLTTRFD